MVNQYKEKIRRFDCAVKIVILDDELEFSKILDKKIKEYCARKDLLYDCQIFSSGKTLLEDDLSLIGLQISYMTKGRCISKKNILLKQKLVSSFGNTSSKMHLPLLHCQGYV